MRERGFIWCVAVVSLLLGGSVGCEDDEASVPDSADERTKQMTQRLPSDTVLTIVLSDLEKFRSAASEAKSTVDRLAPIDDLVDDQPSQGFAATFMGDASYEQLLKKKFWKERGVAPDSSFSLSTVDDNHVVQTYVDDKKAFEKALTGDGDTDTNSIEVAGTDAERLEKEGDTLIWSYDGSLVTVVSSTEQTSPGGEPTTPKETMKEILETEEEEALPATSGFQKYREAAGDRPAWLYSNPEPSLQDPQEIPKGQRRGVKIVREAFEGMGLIIEPIDGNRLESRVWVGLSDKAVKFFDETFRTSVRVDFTKYATDKTLVAVRLEIDWNSLWKSFKSALPKQQQKGLEAPFEQAKEATGIDVRKNVLGNMTGQTGVFVYGVGGKASPELLGNPTRAVAELEALYVMKFGDAETLSEVAEEVAGLSENYLSLRPLEVGKADDKKEVESVQVLEMKMPPGGLQQAVTGMSGSESESDGEPKPAPVQAYIHEDTLMLAARAIPESEIRTMLTGEGDGAKSLSETENLDLGKKFAESERMTGLYVNVDRLRFIFGDILESKLIPSSVTAPVDALEEGLLSTTFEKQGLFADLTVDLVPKRESADEGSSAESGEGAGEESAEDEE